MPMCEECLGKNIEAMVVDFYGDTITVCLDCEIKFDDLSCNRCGGEKSRKAKLCKSCDQEARGWPYAEETIGNPITRWM